MKRNSKIIWWFNLYQSIVLIVTCTWMKLSIPSLDEEWYRVLPIAGIILSIVLAMISIIELKSLYRNE